MEANAGHFYKAWTLMKQPRYFLFNLVPSKGPSARGLVLVWKPTKGLQSIKKHQRTSLSKKNVWKPVIKRIVSPGNLNLIMMSLTENIVFGIC